MMNIFILVNLQTLYIYSTTYLLSLFSWGICVIAVLWEKACLTSYATYELFSMWSQKPILLPEVSDSPVLQGTIVLASTVCAHWHLGDYTLHLSLHNKFLVAPFIMFLHLLWCSICWSHHEFKHLVHFRANLFHCLFCYNWIVLAFFFFHAEQMLRSSWMLLILFVVYLGSVAVFSRVHYFVSANWSPGWIQSSSSAQPITSNGQHFQVCETGLTSHTCYRSDQAGEDSNSRSAGLLRQLPLLDLCTLPYGLQYTPSGKQWSTPLSGQQLRKYFTIP